MEFVWKCIKRTGIMNKKSGCRGLWTLLFSTEQFIDDEGWCNAVKDVDGIRFKFRRQEMLEWRPASLGLVDGIMMTKPYN
jgi:hypothetical protein